MSIYSVCPFFACMAVLLAIAATPLFQAADSPPNPHRDRISTLDGLRGFLALSVFFSHAPIWHEFLLNGVWQPPPSAFYRLLGQVPVEMFFLITGYLFWSRMIRERGRPDWLQLYTGRVFRIGPVYLIAVGVMLMVVLSATGFHFNVPGIQLAEQIGRWLSLGLIEGGDVNGHAGTAYILADVTWTLRVEWLFYLSLPLTALAARRTRTHLLFAGLGLVACLVYVAFSIPGVKNPFYASLFFAGMTCASLENVSLTAMMPDWLTSTLVLALIAVTFVSLEGHDAALIVAIGLAFHFIASGTTVFGLLTNRAARRLGNVSYGIYLLQGLVLVLVFSSGPARAFALASPVQFWAMVLLSGVLLVVVATVAHVAVERTGIELGKRVGSALGTARDRLKVLASLLPIR